MSSINNTEYLMAHLPARMRRDDANAFLQRLLSIVGVELDGFDTHLDTFHEKINPETAPAEFIDFFLYSLFGWGLFRPWFTLDRRRAFYAFITRHYARRGTVAGIKEFLAAFGLRVIVETKPRFWGSTVWGQNAWTITKPLGIVIRLFPEAPAVNEDLAFWGNAVWGAAVGATPSQSIQRGDLKSLLQFVWPLGNIIMIEDMQFPTPAHGAPVGFSQGLFGEVIPG